MQIFKEEALIRRISEANERILQLLHGVIFGCTATLRKLERNILEFVGYDDYEMLDVWGRARALAGRDLRSVGWLLGLEAVSTVDRLRKDICKFLSGQHGRGSP
jgi:hypothetical protein